MIDSRDLRIGNLILGVSDRIETIYSIGSQYVGCAPGKSKLVSPQEYADINGIPLTEDWLLKLGLEPFAGWYEKKHSNIELSIYLPSLRAAIGEFDKEQDSVFFNITNNSVHWLQNWFYFTTGQELQLNT